MPHTDEDKKRATVRIRRIRGQAEALERAVEAGAECSLLLQQIAALRGAAGGLMAEILEMHLRETLPDVVNATGETGFDDVLGDVMRILKPYLK